MMEMVVQFEPREWQRRAFERWSARGYRGIVAVVTGGGKTRLAEMCIADFLRRSPNGRVLVVVPTLALVDQWAVGLSEDLDLSNDSLGLYAEGIVPSSDEVISVLTLVAAREQVPRLAEGTETLLIVDECHRVGSPVNSRALQGSFAATLGLSATPEREHDEGFEELIVPALGDVFFEYGYEDARRDKVIAPFDLVNVEVSLLPHEDERYEKLSKRASQLFSRHRRGDDVEELLGRTLQDRARVAARALMRIPVTVSLLDRHRGVRALIFHEFIDAAEEIQQQLATRNHSVTIYHSKLAPAHRQENLRMYRRGTFDVLVTCRALDEGVNLPETELAIVASATGSRRQRIQRLGRVLRPAPGKDRALIYTLYTTSSERDRLAAEEQGGVSGAETINWLRSG